MQYRMRRLPIPIPIPLRLAIALALLALLGAISSDSNTGIRGIRGVTAAPNMQAATPTFPTSTPSPQPAKPILLTDPVADPHQPGIEWFAPTGHTLRGSFLDYWHKNGGLAQFGYPLSEEFVEPAGGLDGKQPLQVQYFERNRFEHHPENAGSQYEVLLGRLGTAFHVPDPPASPLPGAAYFDQTGHNLSGTFKSYWDTHGGLAIHGYPITEQFEEQNPINGKSYTVQYFERSRMELHPENGGSPYEALLGMLGTQLAREKGYPYGWYPLFGRAVDFSWIAGHRGQFYAPPTCEHIGCNCAEFQYGQDFSERVELSTFNGPDDAYFYDSLVLSSSRDRLFVIFGRYARSGERVHICSFDPKAPGYFVDRVQTNPE